MIEIFQKIFVPWKFIILLVLVGFIRKLKEYLIDSFEYSPKTASKIGHAFNIALIIITILYVLMVLNS